MFYLKLRSLSNGRIVQTLGPFASYDAAAAKEDSMNINEQHFTAEIFEAEEEDLDQ